LAAIRVSKQLCSLAGFQVVHSRSSDTDIGPARNRDSKTAGFLIAVQLPYPHVLSCLQFEELSRLSQRDMETIVNRRMMTFWLLACMVPVAVAGNWPHWRGVNGNGIAPPGTSPPTEWSATKNVKWKVDVPGRGSGSPVIWEDQVFITTAVPADSDTAPQPSRSRRGGAGLQRLDFQLLCFDRATGDLLWKQTAATATPHQGTHSTNGFASASPCTDGERVYAHFGSRGLFCYTMKGDLVWKRAELGKMTTRNSFGEGSSPTLAGDKLIVPWDHEGPSWIAALDKRTGDTIWKTERDEPSCWATPLIIEHAGQQQIVMNGENSARAYNLDTGKELWRCGGQTQRPAASAVAASGMVYVASGFRGSFLGAFRPTGSGDIANSEHVVWSMDRDTPDIASPLLSNGNLYFHKGKSGLLTCVDAATGKVNFGPSRLPGLSSIYASPIAADGYVFLTGRSGTTVVIRDADELQIVARNSVGETVDATPAPVDNELFIRGEQHLFCIAEK